MNLIPMLDLKSEYLHMKKEIDAAIARCLDHQQWILGPEVKDFENTVASYLKSPHCIGVSSGTAALVVALRAIAIKLKGKEFFDKTDKIITTAFTFTATGDAILRAGATPAFVDIDPATFNISTQKIKACLKQTSGVVGILPVHLYGQSCSMDEILHLAQQYNLFVVEDVAQGFGASWKGKKLGTLGDIGAFSFFPSKNLGAFGDGGLVATNDSSLAEIIDMLRKHGGKDKYNVDHIGYNTRLDALQAAILTVKLKYVDEFNEKRRTAAEFYNKNLKEVEGIILPQVLDDAHHVYNQYTIRILNNQRTQFQESLKAIGIASMVYYPYLLNRMKVFEGRSETPFPLSEAEKATKEVLSLPNGPFLKTRDLSTVSKVITEIFAVKSTLS